MGAIRLLNKQLSDNKTQILHIKRDSKETCVVEILDREGNQVTHVGHTTLGNLKKAKYNLEFETFSQKVDKITPYITDESFKKGLKANFERLSRQESIKKAERSERAKERYIMKQLEGLSIQDIFDKLGVI